ncbi:hypothetical protein D3C76_974540 [compost metagenome]
MNLADKEEAKVQELEETYLFNYHSYFIPFLNEHEYILENYVVNYIFESMFPNMSTDKVFKQYIKMATIFSMIKVHFVGISGHYKGINTDLAIKIIQSFVRSIEHNSSYLDGIMGLLEENGFTSVAHIASLLKDRNKLAYAGEVSE